MDTIGARRFSGDTCFRLAGGEFPASQPGAGTGLGRVAAPDRFAARAGHTYRAVRISGTGSISVARSIDPQMEI